MECERQEDGGSKSRPVSKELKGGFLSLCSGRRKVNLENKSVQDFIRKA